MTINLSLFYSISSTSTHHEIETIFLPFFHQNLYYILYLSRILFFLHWCSTITHRTHFIHLFNEIIYNLSFYHPIYFPSFHIAIIIDRFTPQCFSSIIHPNTIYSIFKTYYFYGIKFNEFNISLHLINTLISHISIDLNHSSFSIVLFIWLESGGGEASFLQVSKNEVYEWIVNWTIYSNRLEFNHSSTNCKCSTHPNSFLFHFLWIEKGLLHIIYTSWQSSKIRTLLFIIL